MGMKTFTLQRDVDVSGVSGVGLVAEGVVFHDGSVSMRWCLDLHSTGFYNCVEDVVAIHGHEGATRLVYEDEAHTAYDKGYICGATYPKSDNPYTAHQEATDAVPPRPQAGQDRLRPSRFTALR